MYTYFSFFTYTQGLVNSYYFAPVILIGLYFVSRTRIRESAIRDWISGMVWQGHDSPLTQYYFHYNLYIIEISPIGLVRFQAFKPSRTGRRKPSVQVSTSSLKLVTVLFHTTARRFGPYHINSTKVVWVRMHSQKVNEIYQFMLEKSPLLKINQPFQYSCVARSAYVCTLSYCKHLILTNHSFAISWTNSSRIPQMHSSCKLLLILQENTRRHLISR